MGILRRFALPCLLPAHLHGNDSYNIGSCPNDEQGRCNRATAIRRTDTPTQVELRIQVRLGQAWVDYCFPEAIALLVTATDSRVMLSHKRKLAYFGEL